MRPLLRREGFAVDAMAGVVMATVGIIDVLAVDDREGPVWANVLAMLVLGWLVYERRRVPRAACYAFGVLALVLSIALTPPPALITIFLGLLLFPYTAGSRLQGVWSYAYIPLLVVMIAIVNAGWHDVTIGDYVFPSVLAAASYLAGRNVLHRTALAVELHEAALRAGEERESETRRAVAAERRRIAHEMHDVVAHSISVMVVQAGGARRILDRDPERAVEAAAQIERTGRETLLEMRRLLGVMRRPDAPPELEPNPTLDGLNDLVERARAAGLDLKLTVEGERRTLSQGLELGAYRVVQDALDDALRFGAGTPAEVVVRWSPRALEITVADHRPGMPFGAGAAPALIGVRERVALYGGELRTGQGADGGHEVHVRFPLEAAPGTTPPDSDPVPAQGAA